VDEISDYEEQFEPDDPVQNPSPDDIIDELKAALREAVEALESDGKYTWISIRPEYREVLLARLRKLI